ncbi:MAG: phasin family protein [Rhodanobacteraceae bacterium]|nr:phasin family protein [Rhodanobacteraceae bacterium]MBL0041595.1 phasin family protein [Xanthomonadales bacterium]MBP6078057.1 phasin family protein [Xanthomonadales bacterium]MBP7622563.1 phasin family protein [Xanthomonadales bacterium]
MSKPKFKSKSTSAAASAAASNKAGALVESAQQIWAAGLGALKNAQGSGGKLFENLVKEGLSIEQKTRKFATGKVDEVRDVVETKVEKVKERASDTWDKLEKVFEDRVSRALGKLGVPGRDEMEALVSRVEELSKAVKKLNPQAAAPAAAKKAAAKKAPAKKAASKAK